MNVLPPVHSSPRRKQCALVLAAVHGCLISTGPCLLWNTLHQTHMTTTAVWESMHASQYQLASQQATGVSTFVLCKLLNIKKAQGLSKRVWWDKCGVTCVFSPGVCRLNWELITKWDDILVSASPFKWWKVFPDCYVAHFNNEPYLAVLCRSPLSSIAPSVLKCWSCSASQPLLAYAAQWLIKGHLGSCQGRFLLSQHFGPRGDGNSPEM